MLRIWAVSAVMLCVVGLAWGEPATTKPVDLSNPRAALKSFVEALKSGDVEGAKKACHAPAESDRKVMEAGVEFEAALEKLIAQVEAKFGEGSAATLREKLAKAGPTDVVPLMEKAVEAAPENSSEDSVVVPWSGAEDLRMVRVDGDWKIDVEAQMKNLEESKRGQMLKQMPAAAKKLAKVSEAVESGKVTSVDDVIGLIEGKNQP
jgi:hypothetical protein